MNNEFISKVQSAIDYLTIIIGVIIVIASYVIGKKYGFSIECYSIIKKIYIYACFVVVPLQLLSGYLRMHVKK